MCHQGNEARRKEIEMTPYERIIRENSNHDPRHVEAFMRLEYTPLEHLPLWQFKDEIKIAEQCIDVGGNIAAESLAKSYGM